MNTHSLTAATRLALLLLCVPSLLLAADPEPFPPGDDFGAALTLVRATPLSVVAAHPERFEGKPVVVRGKISDVCQKKGCWTVITDGNVNVRVRFRDYGFFLPKDSTGREAIAQGLVSAETISEKTARHFARESVGEDPAAIKGPQHVVRFTATGVRLLAEN